MLSQFTRRAIRFPLSIWTPFSPVPLLQVSVRTFSATASFALLLLLCWAGTPLQAQSTAPDPGSAHIHVAPIRDAND